MEEIKIRRRKVIRDGTIIIISIFFAIILHQNNYLANFLKNTYGTYFILGAFLTGISFAFTFTVAVATSVFLIFAQTHNPILIAIFGGLGASVGHSFIFKFLKDDLLADFEYLEKYFPENITKRIIHSKLTLWLAPIVAAIMLLSPLPDEIGLILLASIKTRYHHFFLISFFLSTAGILIISLTPRLFW